jgi:hypothetical protein
MIRVLNCDTSKNSLPESADECCAEEGLVDTKDLAGVAKGFGEGVGEGFWKDVAKGFWKGVAKGL